MRVLAIDHGTARAGCAICDPSETVVRPVGVVEPPEPEAVADLVADQGAELVVVGLPLTLAGEEAAQAAVARRFSERLAALVDAPVETYDERLTTRLADDSRRSGAEAPADALAAAHLLEGYLAWRSAHGNPGGGGSEP
jgi:putative Holliday junction resolvase